MKKIIKWVLVILAGLVILGLLFGGSEKAEKLSDENHKVEIQTETEESTPASKLEDKPMLEESGVDTILAEQKQKAEDTTKRAVELITQNKTQEAKGVLNDRWNELAELRVDILYDDSLIKSEKELLDSVFKEEQESLTSILSEYEELYGTD